jgi:TRAP-type C4-dicarboxylate transport system permease small subunit
VAIAGKQAVRIDRLAGFEKVVNRLSRWLNWFTLAGLFIMSLVTVIDVISAKLFHLPILWAYDVTSLLGLVVLVFAIAFTQVKRGHIEIELLVTRTSKRTQAIIACIINLLCVVLAAVMTWQMLDFALILQRQGRVSDIQGIPLAPFGYAAAFCFLVLGLALLLQLLKSITEALKS